MAAVYYVAHIHMRLLCTKQERCLFGGLGGLVAQQGKPYTEHFWGGVLANYVFYARSKKTEKGETRGLKTPKLSQGAAIPKRGITS